MGVVMESRASRISKYDRAKKHVEDIKGWYSHIVIYLIINVLLQLFYSGVFDDGRITDHFPGWVRFTTPFFWGISVIVHGIYVHKGQFLKRFYKNWEERKIKEIMEDEEQESVRQKHWD